MLSKTINILHEIEKLSSLSAGDVLKWAAQNYNEKLTLSSALGLECQVLTDMIHKKALNIPIFTLDTGRLFNETLNLLSQTEKHYKIKLKVYFPNNSDVERMVSNSGINLFYESIELRKECCSVRKLEPLKRALSGIECWITGLRREQSETRDSMKIIELDKERGLLKVNPLIDWTESQIIEYIKQNKVPYNPLHEQGYPSIGCCCCTRKVKQGKHSRSGRWWWEKAEHRECGLHIKNGKIVREIK